jgi:hypothetical protein
VGGGHGWNDAHGWALRSYHCMRSTWPGSFLSGARLLCAARSLRCVQVLDELNMGHLRHSLSYRGGATLLSGGERQRCVADGVVQFLGLSVGSHPFPPFRKYTAHYLTQLSLAG